MRISTLPHAVESGSFAVLAEPPGAAEPRFRRDALAMLRLLFEDLNDEIIGVAAAPSEDGSVSVDLKASGLPDSGEAWQEPARTVQDGAYVGG